VPRGVLTYRPLVPGSDQHLGLLERARTPKERLGWVLYPDLMHRRACAQIARAAARVTRKQETPGMPLPEASVPITNEMRARGDGCSTECA
jgi:hypothetical protein